MTGPWVMCAAVRSEKSSALMSGMSGKMAAARVLCWAVVIGLVVKGRTVLTRREREAVADKFAVGLFVWTSE